MSVYVVNGTVCGRPVNSVVEADNGAEAIKTVARPHMRKFSRKGGTVRCQRARWFACFVRLNATQVDPTTIK